MGFSRTIAACLLGALLCDVVPAHDPGLSSTVVRRAGDGLVLELRFNAADAAGAVPAADVDGDGRLDARELETGRDALLAFAQRWLRVSGGQGAIDVAARDVAIGDNGDVEFGLAVAGSFEQVRVEVTAFGAMPRGHRHCVALGADAAASAVALLHAGLPSVDLDLARLDGAGAAASTTAWSFVGMGIEHILIGFDHVMFLLSLLVVAQRLGAVARLITAFTVAHSVTLATATLGLVAAPAAVVEPVIAASIAWVAIENLVRRQPRHRTALVFGFGLVHGFGFASVLQDLGIVAHGGVAVPLLAFNAGVEAGQLAIAAVAVPLFAVLRRRASFVRLGQPALCIGLAACGLYWFVERTVLA